MPTREQIFEFLDESNKIEGIYDGDSLGDAFEAWEYLAAQEEINLKVVCETHRILMKNQTTLPKSQIGKLRQCHVRIVGAGYTPIDLLSYRLVPTALLRWCQHNMRVSPPADPIALHVEYEKIHPFVDGNGRTGRMFLNWLLLKRGQPIAIFKNDEKQEYYKLFH